MTDLSPLAASDKLLAYVRRPTSTTPMKTAPTSRAQVVARDPAGPRGGTRAGRPQAALDQPYGKSERQRYDLSRRRSDPKPRGMLAIVHGGYWMALSDDFSHLAAGRWRVAGRWR